MRKACHIVFFCILFCFISTTGNSQENQDSTNVSTADSTILIKKQRAVRPFSFITNVPGDLARIVKYPFQKKNLKPLIFLGSATTLLFLLDQPIINTAEKFFREIGIDPKQDWTNVITVADVDLLTVPDNVNTFFYLLGDTQPSLLLVSGFFIYGQITKDIRARRTASELLESFINVNITVQTLKRIFARQAPNRATETGGKWHWFVSPREYNRDVTNYIAYPSGHMANMMSAVTVLAENYPEKKWIRPVGYTLTGLTALSQLNNKTHWASDYLLGLAIGYVSGKIVHLRNEKKNKPRKLLSM